MKNEKTIAYQSSSKIKARIMTFLIYPETAPEDWIERLENTPFPVAISPLHDKDKAEKEAGESEKKFKERIEKEGAYKKPHYHVIIVFEKVLSVEGARNRIKRILDVEGAKKQPVSFLKKVFDVENLHDYLTHTSSSAIKKGKHVYDASDIQYLNDFDIEQYLEMDPEEKRERLYDLMDMIKKLKIKNVIELENAIEKGEGIKFGFTYPRQVRQIIISYSSKVKLYLDGAYQSENRGDRGRE